LQSRYVELVDRLRLVGGEGVDILGSKKAVGGAADTSGGGAKRAASTVDIGTDRVLQERLSGLSGVRLRDVELLLGLRDLRLQALHLHYRLVIALA
jgi:hypothetical protein